MCVVVGERGWLHVRLCIDQHGAPCCLACFCVLHLRSVLLSGVSACALPCGAKVVRPSLTSLVGCVPLTSLPFDLFSV